MTYEFVRNFSGTWGLIYLFVVFVGVIAFVLRPGAKDAAAHAANIPLNDEIKNKEIL